MSENTKQPEMEKECCPKFDPAPWDEKIIEWQDKLFIKEHVKAAFYMPLGLEDMMLKNCELMEKSGAMPARTDFIVMAADQTMFGADYYLHVTKEIPGKENVKISGKFLSKVFEGPFSKMHGWMKEMEQYVASKNEKLEKMYCFYTTCPKCAKKYGKNYVVLLAKI